MLRKAASCLVGVIVIETLPDGRQDSLTPTGGYDSTLAGFLAYLATGGASDRVVGEHDAGDDAPRAAGGRREPARRSFDRRWGSFSGAPWVRPARLIADLPGLRAQLEQALGQARLAIARSRQVTA